MDINDKLNDLKAKAQDAAVEHKDQIKEAVGKAQAAADQRTEGKYHDQIAKAGAKVEDYLHKLDPEADGGTPPTGDDPDSDGAMKR